MGGTKDLSAFEQGMVVGASVSRIAMLAYTVSLFMLNSLCVSRMFHHSEDIQPT